MAFGLSLPERVEAFDDHRHRPGVDGEGAVHRYRPGDRTILVVQDGQVEYRQSLSARSVRA